MDVSPRDRSFDRGNTPGNGGAGDACDFAPPVGQRRAEEVAAQGNVGVKIRLRGHEMILNVLKKRGARKLLFGGLSLYDWDVGAIS